MKNLYLEKRDKKDCNGCGACTLVCPKKCIHMEQDEEGFFYPVIDEKECIKCNRCKNICSNYNLQEERGQAYIAFNNNEEERINSASGGMYYILAKYVIEKHGVVFGVKYDENLIARHDYAENLEECKKFMGSKYVRSDIEGIYQKVKEFLDNDRYVLFTGTPCQNNGLKTYLNKEYEKLILCDIICHANPSPKVLDKYINEIEESKHIKVKNISFRSKENGWSNSTPIIEFETGEKEEDRTFYTAFTKELINRPSCHSCPFVSVKRISDFTIGDLWGIESIKTEMKNDEKGISLFVVNSDKAKEIFNEISNNMKYEEIDLDLAFSYNHNENLPINKNREKFFRKMNEGKKIIPYMKKYSKESIFKRIKRKVLK